MDLQQQFEAAAAASKTCLKNLIMKPFCNFIRSTNKVRKVM